MNKNHCGRINQSLMLIKPSMFNLYEVLIIYSATWFLQHLIAYGEFCLADEVL
jgi:hypothetical protein